MSYTARSAALHHRMRKLLLDGFHAADIAEPLCSFDGDKPGREVAAVLTSRHLPVAGVRLNGELAGVVVVDRLDERLLEQQLLPFDAYPILPSDAPFTELIPVLDHSPFCLLREFAEPDAIVIRADIQKPPVRMWLFGMVTILELYVTAEVERLYPQDSWQSELSAGRLQRAGELQKERERRHQHASLLDCLQLKDKTDLLLRSPEALAGGEFESRTAVERVIKQLESLRNNLAHAQDIVSYDWQAIVILARRVNRIVDRLAPKD